MWWGLRWRSLAHDSCLPRENLFLDCAKIWRIRAKIWRMSTIIDALFSKATKAILANLFLRPDGMHLRALMAATSLGSASAQRELGKLAAAGVLLREEVGKVILYKPNPGSPVFNELGSIMRKTEGVGALLKDVLLPFQARIKRAFIYGSVAKGTDTVASDIDLMVISADLGSADLYPPLVELEARLGRKISLTVYRPVEWQRKLDDKNHFLVSVMSGQKIELIGEPDG
jgi:predicted nucleotidyltransferase